MNVVVTGGSRGIGRAIVLKMVEKGHSCAFTYVSNEDAANETIELAKKISSEATVKSYKADQKNPDEVEDVISDIIDDFDTIDALVNNAAIVKNNAMALMSNEEWDEVIAANLSGPFYVTRGLLMHFISNRNGRIVNISSLAQTGCSGQANYAASKAGLIGLTKTIAKEYGPKGITANVVTVGVVETDMVKENMADALRDYWMEFSPIRRLNTAEDIANAVHFLISDEGTSITGEVLNVSGGLTYVP